LYRAIAIAIFCAQNRVPFLRAVAIVFKYCVRDAPRKQSTIARLTIALDALGATYLKRAAQIGMDPAALHSDRGVGLGMLDSLPHTGGGDAPVRLRFNS
jgi:hypothetical protein